MEKKQRIEKLQQEVKKNNLDGVLLFYSRDIFYYTGTAQPAYLVVLQDDYHLYVKSGFDFATRDVFIDEDKLTAERKLEVIYGEMFSQPRFKHLGLELDMLPVKQFQAIQSTFQGFKFSDISPAILEQRKMKDAEETAQIERACVAVDAGHQALLSCQLTGMTELEVAAKVEQAQRLAGHDGCFFFRHPDFFMSHGPMAAGSNLSQFSGVVYSITGKGLSASVPVGPSLRQIQSGEPVMVDIPTSVNGYHADQTRTYFAGKASNELKDLYAALKEVQGQTFKNIEPGILCKEVYQAAVAHAERLHCADAFLSFGEGKKSKMIGHGIGLEVNEPPIISSYDTSVIGENFVMAVEMHMYRQNVGVVKLEDTLLVKAKHNQILTFSSRELCEL